MRSTAAPSAEDDAEHLMSSGTLASISWDATHLLVMIQVLIVKPWSWTRRIKCGILFSPAFLVFFLSFLSNEMMSKAMCNHPKHGDSFIQATILEQLFVYTEKNWHPRF